MMMRKSIRSEGAPLRPACSRTRGGRALRHDHDVAQHDRGLHRHRRDQRLESRPRTLASPISNAPPKDSVTPRTTAPVFRRPALGEPQREQPGTTEEFTTCHEEAIYWIRGLRRQKIRSQTDAGTPRSQHLCPPSNSGCLITVMRGRSPSSSYRKWSGICRNLNSLTTRLCWSCPGAGMSSVCCRSMSTTTRAETTTPPLSI